MHKNQSFLSIWMEFTEKFVNNYASHNWFDNMSKKSNEGEEGNNTSCFKVLQMYCIWEREGGVSEWHKVKVNFGPLPVNPCGSDVMRGGILLKVDQRGQTTQVKEYFSPNCKGSLICPGWQVCKMEIHYEMVCPSVSLQQPLSLAFSIAKRLLAVII